MTTPHTFRQVWAIPTFRKLWVAQLISISGDFVAVYAVYNFISFRLHGSADQVSGIMASYLLPLALVSPVAGVFVDRWRIKTTMVASDLIRAVLVLLLLRAETPWHVYVIFLLMSSVSSFYLPAQSVAVPQIVPRDALLTANAMLQQTMQLVRIFSPAAAMGMVSWLGEQACYWVDFVSFLLSAWLIASLPIPERPEHPHKTLKAVLGDLSSGVRFIFGHRALSFVFAAMTAGMFALSAFSALLAVYVRDVLQGGPGFFGILGSLIGSGAIVGSLVIRRMAMRFSKTHLVACGIGGNGLCVLLLSFFHNYPATIACTMGIGISVAFIIIPAATLSQEETPLEMRGRVSSSSLSMVALAQGIALLLSGSLAAKFGILNLYTASGLTLMTICLLGLAALHQRSRQPLSGPAPDEPSPT